MLNIANASNAPEYELKIQNVFIENIKDGASCKFDVLLKR